MPLGTLDHATDAATSLDLSLESWLDGEPRCQSMHDEQPEGYPSKCSVRATASALASCLGQSLLWCASRVREFEEYDIAHADCADCHRPIAECWLITPL